MHWMPQLFLHCFSQWPSSSSIGPVFSLDFLLLLTYLKKPFLLSNTTLDSFNSNWALAFCVFPLHKWIAPLYPSCEDWSCFQRTYTFFFHLSSKRISLFSQAGHLPRLLSLQHIRIACSCASKRWSLNTDQPLWTTKPLKADIQGTLLNSFLITLKICSPEVQDSNSFDFFSHYTEIFKLDHFMITVAKTVTYHNIPE